MKVLELSGEWTVGRAWELREILVEALKSGEQVTIGLEKITQADLSCLQLLCSAHRTSLFINNNPIALGEDRSEAFIKTVIDSGYARSLGCHKDPDKGCLWKGDWK